MATTPATATTAAARLPTPCCKPAGAAPMAPVVALALGDAEKVSLAEPVADAAEAESCDAKLDPAAAPVVEVTTVLVHEQEES